MSIANPEDGTLIEVSKSYLKYFGHTRQEVIGKTGAELGHIRHKKFHNILYQIKEQGNAESIFLRFKTKDNEIRHTLVNFKIININQKLLLLCIYTDISKSAMILKNRQDDILKIFNSIDGDGIILINDYGTRHASLFYANGKAKNIFKKCPLNKLLKKLEGHESILLRLNSKSYHVRKMGNFDKPGMQQIIIFSLPDSMHLKQTMERFDLTPRQQEVAISALNGNSNSEIAKKLHISEYTVKGHMKDIFHIMRISNRSELFPRLFNLR